MLEPRNCLICGTEYIPRTVVSKYCSENCRRSHYNYLRDAKKWGLPCDEVSLLEGAKKRYYKRIGSDEFKAIEIEKELDAEQIETQKEIKKPHQKKLHWIQVSSSSGYYGYV